MKVVITGASSGIGREVARLFAQDGHKVVACARRTELLEELAAQYPSLTARYLDVNSPGCPASLMKILDEDGPADIYFHSSGIGFHNQELDPDKERSVLQTNCMGFAACIDAAFAYFREKGGGHIAAISSIAGTMGLGAAPSYSGSKAFCSTYLQALAQLSGMTKAGIAITDIRPGFVKTGILDSSRKYPMLMEPDHAAARIYKAVKKRRRVAIIDWKYSILVWLWKHVPDWIWVRLNIDAR